MRASILLGATVASVCVTTLLVGCGDGGPVDLDESPALAEAAFLAPQAQALMKAEKRHPFEQVSSGDHWPIGWCDQAAGIPRIWIQGSGTGTAVGRFEWAKSMCMNVATGEVTDGEGVLTAANGDEIHLTFRGQALPDPGPPTIDFVYVIDGGTGRFLNAVGALETRTILTSESTWTNSGSGWIIYDASDRSGR